MKELKLLLPLLAISSLILFLSSSSVFSSNIGKINAEVQMSVCGNLDIEGGEQCEGINLNGNTCQSLGFKEGLLTCDIACDFDITKCVPYPKQEEVVEEKKNNTIVIPEVILPPILRLFDVDMNDKISIKELSFAVQTWVSSWVSYYVKIYTQKQDEAEINVKTDLSKCDINSDESCDLKDFSILLYYVE